MCTCLQLEAKVQLQLSSFIDGYLIYWGGLSLSWIQHSLIQSVCVASLLWGVPCLCLLHTCVQGLTQPMYCRYIFHDTGEISYTFFICSMMWRCGDSVSHWISHLWADCARAFWWGKLGSLIGIIISLGSTPLLRPRLAFCSRDFSSVVRSAPSGSLREATSPEKLQRTKEQS